ncbi:hypothetical protein ENBRE01_1089 [Enteropsectra breve]|nr:hypothetical protein ENBRE01_1089 [Enteropsectra breve]
MRWTRIIGYFFIFVLKQLDLPSFFYNSCDPSADYEHYAPLYTAFVPRELFLLLCNAADFLAAYKLRSPKYLYLTLLSPLDCTAIENLILLYSPSFLDPLLQLFSRMYFPVTKYPLFLDEASTNHLPCFNILWFYNMSVWDHLYEYTTTMHLLLGLFLVSKSVFFLPLFKHRSSFRSYIPFIIHSRVLSCYVAMLFSFFYYSHIYFNYTGVSQNFVYFPTLAFTVLYLFDLKYLRKIDYDPHQKHVSCKNKL